MKKSLLSIALIIVLISNIQAQQYPLFTNYVINQIGFNPAVAGLEQGFEGKFTYRTQWTGINHAPQTQLFSLAGRTKKIPIGIGGYFFKDGSGALERTGGAGILSFTQKVGEATSISVGASMGFFETVLAQNVRAVDMNDPLFANAFDGVGAPDVNIGAYLKTGNFYAGFSVPQFLKRTLQFQDATNVQTEYQRHLYGMAGYRLYFGKMYLEPSILVKQVSHAPLQWDAAAKLGTGTPFWVGITYRSNAALTALAGLDLKQNIFLAYAYDITANGLSKYSKGSHEITVGLKMGKPKDSDGDGIPDKEDKCPEQPGKTEKDGCPEDKKEEAKCNDIDKDGICDLEDECPNVPGPKDNKGCPIGDRDRDGILDKDDKCPDIPGTRQNAGCPLADRDNDGIRDDLDKCPDEAGPVTSQGCPGHIPNDADGDGVLDDEDECPNTPGPKDRNGCPSVSPAELEALNLAIKNLYFDTDKWVIKPESKQHLDRLAKVMTKQRDWKVRIAGFADARGTDEHNLTLSKNRSEAAMYYLMQKGVKREQLVVEYYGEQHPAAHNSQEQGWQQNRRVEMEFIFN